jgi:hypothetical protein
MAVNDETGWQRPGRQMNKNELAAMAKSHERRGMTEDKWVSLYLLGLGLLICLLGWLLCR